MNRQDASVGAAPRAVLDTNTVLDMLLFEDAAALALADAIRSSQLRWIGTSRMREEVAGVLHRDRMGRWAPPTQASAILAFVDQWMLTRPAPDHAQAPRCRDTADQIFIDLAWADETEWLLTRDKALLKLARPAAARAIQVCTPAVWSTGWAARCASATLIT